MQREHLKVALQDIGKERGELVRAEIEIDAHAPQILLHDRGLQAGFLVRRDLQRQPESGQRAVTIRIAIAGLVEQAHRPFGIVA